MTETTTETAFDVGKELAAFFRKNPNWMGQGAAEDDLGVLLSRLLEASNTTAADAFTLSHWAGGLLQGALDIMPEPDDDEPSGIRLVMAVAAILASRSARALGDMTGIPDATLDGDVRLMN